MNDRNQLQKNKSESHWYAIYTRSRSEKKLYDELCEKEIECYLPLQKQLRIWSDRKKWVEVPLFSSYVFVKVNAKEYYTAINSLYATCYVTICGKAVAIPERQLIALQLFLKDEQRKLEITNKDMLAGDRVEVITGSLAGVQGEIYEVRGKHRLLLRFESLGACVSTEIQTTEVKLISFSPKIAS